ncbi:MAG: hypothetical protein LBN42_00660 [Oscillospiraceae bacterium]|nr:hypothetical protein [Oscillospiraceae bacterium]
MKIKVVDLAYKNAGCDYLALKRAGYMAAIIDTEPDSWNMHTQGAIGAKMDVGAYVNSRAQTVEDARVLAKKAISTMSGIPVIYPVFYVINDPIKDKDRNTANFKAFAEVITAAGYKCGILANDSLLNDCLNKDEIIPNYHLWYIDWTQDPNNPPTHDYGQDIWQWGIIEPDREGGYVIGNMDTPSENALSANICYVDYHNDPPIPPDPPSNCQDTLRKIAALLNETAALIASLIK